MLVEERQVKRGRVQGVLRRVNAEGALTDRVAEIPVCPGTYE